MDEPIEIPDYVLSRHARAKRIRLSVNSFGEVKVTAPKTVPSAVVKQFVVDNLDWINSATQRQKDPRTTNPNLGFNLPESILLKSISESYVVSVNFSSKRSLKEKNGYLYLYGNETSDHLNSLKSWVKEKAKILLHERLQLHAERMGLEYNKVFIKNQRTRWGSCSSKQNINLNQNLIFVEKHLVDYLLIHELSHLCYPNHARRFWQFVEAYDPNYRENDKALNHSTRTIPLWALSR